MIKTIAFALILVSQANAGAEITVIANENVMMSGTTLHEIFTGEKTMAGGTKLILADNKSGMGEFCTRVMKMDTAKYCSLWAKKSFRDGTPTPRLKMSDSEVIDFVRSTPGGIGYIVGPKPTGVKELGKY